MQAQTLAADAPSQRSILEIADRKPASKRFYRPELDTLRALAFFMVFTAHTVSWQFGKLSRVYDTASQIGAFGLPLFFVLSAFLITELLLREHERTGSINIRLFSIRRALRIWPLYFAMVFFGIFWHGPLRHILHHPGIPSSLSAAYLTFWANWWYVFHGFPDTFLSPLWSISVEEQFYLLWPITAFIAGKRGLIVMASIGCLLFIPVLYYLGPATLLATWPNSFIQAQFLGLGALIAISLHGTTLKISPATRLVLMIGGFCVLAGAASIASKAVWFAAFVSTYLLIQLGCALLLIGIYQSDFPFLRWKPCVWLGKISFGLYVFHYLVLLLVYRAFIHLLHGQLPGYKLLVINDLVCLALTITFAAASYRWLEKPFLNLKERFTIVRSRAA